MSRQQEAADATSTPALAAAKRDALVVAAVIPLAALALVSVDNMGYLAETPIMLVIGLLVMAGACLPISTLALWPFNTPLRLHTHVGIMSSMAFAVIYSTGWGAALIVGGAVLVGIDVGSIGSKAARAYALWVPFAVLAGQVAIAMGVAPTLIPTPDAHGIALVAGGLTEFACIIVAVTTLRSEEASRSLQEGEERFRSLIQNVGDLVLITDDTLTIRYASPSAWEVGGYRPEDLVGRPAHEFADPEFLVRVFDALQETIVAPGKSYTVELPARHADGTYLWAEITVTNLMANPSVNGIVLNLRPVEERKQLEKRLSDLAFYDPVTKIPNRRWFLERLEQVSSRARRHHARIAVLFIDLDFFKSVNDTYGHAEGDELLARSAERIRFCLRQEDTVARLGGDEFVVLLDDLHYPNDSIQVAQRIVDAHRLPFVVGGRELRVTASVGITSCDPNTPAPPDELVRQADVAMYVAKAKGRDQYDLYTGPAGVGDGDSGHLPSEVKT